LHALAFTPDGKHLATAGQDQTIRYWHVRSGKELTSLPTDTPTRALVFADLHTLLSGGDNGTIITWDAEKWTRRQTRPAHQGAVHALALSKNGLLATAGADALIKLWDGSATEPRFTLRRHTGPVLALAFTPGGRALVSAGEDASVCVWDPGTGQLRNVLAKHKKQVPALAMHPFGDNLVSGSHDTLLYRWQAGKIEEKDAEPAKDGERKSTAAPGSNGNPGVVAVPLQERQHPHAKNWLAAGLWVGLAISLLMAATTAAFLYSRRGKIG
jgi:WD40 repeat protein